MITNIIALTIRKTSKHLLIILFSLLFTLTYGQAEKNMDKSKVDERIEIVSIVFRLAGNREYSSELFKTYTDRIAAHYSLYKDHELIKFIKQIKQESGIGYDVSVPKNQTA